MIVVRNSKDSQRKNPPSQSSSPTAYTPVRMPVHSEAIQTAAGRSCDVLVERTRLSREAPGHSIRNEARAMNGDASGSLFASTSPSISSDSRARVGMMQLQRPYTYRSGLAPLPPRPTIWSSNGSHFTHHRLTESGSTVWQHHQHPSGSHVHSRNYSGGQAWKLNRETTSPSAHQSLSVLTRVPPSIDNHTWEWRSQSESRNDSRSLSHDTHASQREWSTNGHWRGNGHCVSDVGRKQAFLAGHSSGRYRDDSTSPTDLVAFEKERALDIGQKRSQDEAYQCPPLDASLKRSKGLGMLDLLCQATLDVGPMQDNPTGCSCPKSKCIALYCDCFKAGRRCDEKNCGCIDCKNTLVESGVDGARTKAIRSILARNPRAFITAGVSAAEKRPPPGEIACNCIRSHCLKLYCSCFSSGKTCTESCTCVSCANTEEDISGERKLAVQLCLEKRPDAFQQRVREPGLGCACKNNRCIRRYCECFRSNLVCTDKCTCRQCENHTQHGSVPEKDN